MGPYPHGETPSRVLHIQDLVHPRMAAVVVEELGPELSAPNPLHQLPADHAPGRGAQQHDSQILEPAGLPPEGLHYPHRAPHGELQPLGGGRAVPGGGLIQRPPPAAVRDQRQQRAAARARQGKTSEPPVRQGESTCWHIGRPPHTNLPADGCIGGGEGEVTRLYNTLRRPSSLDNIYYSKSQRPTGPLHPPGGPHVPRTGGERGDPGHLRGPGGRKVLLPVVEAGVVEPALEEDRRDRHGVLQAGPEEGSARPHRTHAPWPPPALPRPAPSGRMDPARPKTHATPPTLTSRSRCRPSDPPRPPSSPSTCSGRPSSPTTGAAPESGRPPSRRR